MRKNREIALFVVALVLFVKCQAESAEEMSPFIKATQSLSNIMVLYESKFDRRVKFEELQHIILAIDRAMMGYMGSAKDRLDDIRNLSSDARLKYGECVKPMFEWCISSSSSFDMLIPYIRTITNLSVSDKKVLLKMISDNISAGLKKANIAIRLLNEVQLKTHELSNVFNQTNHNVTMDFAPNGYYGKLNTTLNDQLQDLETRHKYLMVESIFTAIGSSIFGFGLFLLPSIEMNFNIRTEKMWNEERTYREKLDMIEYTFKILKEKIAEASSVVTEINDALDEDKNNLHILRAKIEAANTNQGVLEIDFEPLRNGFVTILTNLKDQCTKYNNWHGYDEPFYYTNGARKSRKAVNILNVQELVDGSES
ncbi:hypothetical protein KR067_008798 [Drosophila pandora]|nr:hypothetical protein KR067_008798 [Drosophila pandora]